MNLIIPKLFLKRLSRLPDGMQNRVMVKLDRLQQNPNDPALDIKPLSGKLAGKYTLRVGDFTIIYSIKGDDIVIASFGLRGGVYG